MTAHRLHDDGSLKPETDRILYNIGGLFTVDRQTGVYRGSVGTNASDDEQRKVVVFVPPDNSFYLASTSELNIDYLVVQDFKPGRMKPFVFATFSYLLTGTCER